MICYLPASIYSWLLYIIANTVCCQKSQKLGSDVITVYLEKEKKFGYRLSKSQYFLYFSAIAEHCPIIRKSSLALLALLYVNLFGRKYLTIKRTVSLHISEQK